MILLPLLLVTTAADFTGNAACRPCHAAIVQSYEATPMARSTGPAGESEVPAGRFQHRASGKQYTITSDGTVRIRSAAGSGGGRPATQRFDYRIGSGAAGYSYIIARNGLLFQAPITWYSHAKRWDAAPGYQDDPVMAWDRPIEPSCLMCHASQVVPVFGTQNRYVDPPFRQNGVACERCHGPGSEHIAGRGARMVVPTRLDAERRDDVCRQCHLLSESRIPRAGHVFGEYRAGLRLGDYVAYIVRDEPGSEPALRATSHLEKMNASRCKIASGDKLWCGTCHDVHTVPADPVAWYRTKCEGCHAAGACRRGNNCTACHMPKAKAVDAGHGVFTDHSIPRRPRNSNSPAPLTTWRLKPFGPADAGDRELGLAYLEAYKRTKDERQKAEALRLLRR